MAERMIRRWRFERAAPASSASTTPGVVSAKERLAALAGHLRDSETAVEPARTLPVLARCEVLVVGGGPAGLSAALAAARAGADTVLVEQGPCFGGTITQVGIETLGWYRYPGTANDATGIGRELERAAARLGGAAGKFPHNDSECLDAERFQLVADRLVLEAGVRPLLHCAVVGVLLDRNRLQGVVTESKSGRTAIAAQAVVDCTGDADVAHLAGCRTRSLAVADRMGCTKVFSAAGVDVAKFKRYADQVAPRTYADWSHGEWEQSSASRKEDGLRSPYLGPEIAAAAARGAVDPADAAGLTGSWSSLTEAGEATNLNLAHMRGYDMLDVRDQTKAEIEGRRQASVALAALRAEVPGFEAAKLRNFGQRVGVRDTRKLVSRRDLHEADVLGQLRCPDSIGVYPEFVDGYSILTLPTTGRYFQVPFGCMAPAPGPGKVSNLLVAGRCVGGDRAGHAAMRNMMACTVTGQGAGAAAAVAVRRGEPAAEVDVAALQAELRRQGVRLE